MLNPWMVVEIENCILYAIAPSGFHVFDDQVNQFDSIQSQ
jgi:hypothetical protein